MKKFITKASVYCSLFVMAAGAAQAQMADTTTEFRPHGTLWGYTFGDFAYKGNSDILNRGGSNQYTGMPQNANTFQFRRIYLGYNYDISQKFTAEFLLAAEDDYTAGSITEGSAGTSVGDVTAGGKFTPYVKYANIAWKNIFKNSDLKIGQQATPSFAKTSRNDQTAEEVWGYRCVERTISDIRRTPSFDMGTSLQGWFDKKGNFGYMLMVANGNSAKPATNSYKWLYGDVYGKFFDKRLVIDIYQDYEKLAWGVWANPGKATDPNGPEYAARQMTKLFAAWNTNKLTIGFEGFENTIMSGIKLTGTDGNIYYRTQNTMAMSVYVRGRILSASNGDPRLNFFARFDNYDPSGDLSSTINSGAYKSFTNVVSQYDPSTKEQFVTAGIDYMPVRNVHIIPNLWLNTYTSALSETGVANDGVAYSKMNNNVTGIKGTDAVWRLTFYYIYNPKQGTTRY
jgi:hypothetical protein